MIQTVVAAPEQEFGGSPYRAVSRFEEWIKVDYATTQNPYTNSKRTLRENSDMIYNAYMSRLEAMEEQIKHIRNID